MTKAPAFAGGTMHVLVVEDDRADGRLVEEALRAATEPRCDHEWAATLADALATLERTEPDVVLLDLTLPDSQGPDTLQRVLEAAGSTPVVVLTGHADEALALELLREGAQDYLPKNELDATLLRRTLRYAIERKRTQQDILDREAQFRALAGTATDAIICTDADSEITYANHAAEVMFGYPVDELVGERLLKLMPQKARQAHLKAMNRYLSTGGQPGVVGRTVEMEGLRADGTMFPVEVSVGSWEARDGPFFTAILRDISERRRVEEQVWLLQTVTRSMGEARDAGGALATAVGHICQATGWPVGEAWVPEPSAKRLAWAAGWHRDRPSLSLWRAESERVSFGPGQGLPGRVWERREPIVVTDADHDDEHSGDRADLIDRFHLRPVAGVPVMADADVVAVLIFFEGADSADARLADHVELAATVAAQVGAILRLKLVADNGGAPTVKEGKDNGEHARGQRHGTPERKQRR